nr:auxin-induced protein X15 [Ipomoea batatas]
MAGGGNGGRGRTPKGHFVVYVGEELRRYVLPTSYLNNPFFQKLLEEAAEEYGFCSHKGIVLPCHKSTFHRMLIRLHPNYIH